eukprot:5411696-Amphidinium_carterae.3
MTIRHVDTLRINLQQQQLDVTHEVQHATRLHQEYLQAVAAMLWSLLLAGQDLIRLQHQSEGYCHSKWLALERQAHLEYSQLRTAQLDERAISGHRSGSTQTTLLQKELRQARRQAAAQLSTLRAEPAQALNSSITPENRDRAHGELQKLCTARNTFAEELHHPEMHLTQSQAHSFRFEEHLHHSINFHCPDQPGCG